jgi:serine/threonine-protein kinase RsbW
MVSVELEIPPRSAYVGVVRLAIASLARSAGMDEEAVDDLKIAVSEACTNAVLSNEQAESEERVAVSWSVENGRAVIEVADGGSLYDARDATGSLDAPAGRVAMSAVLLESLAETVEFIPRPGGGTRARLGFSLT